MTSKSLYINILNEEGVTAAINLLQKQNILNKMERQIIQEVLKLILENNYLQTNGTVRGATTTPTYANLFMTA